MIFCSRYGSSRNILSKIPSFKIIFSLNISGSLNIREEGRVELKNRNNNTDIFSSSVAWLAQRKREREIESIFRSRKRISTRFSTKSGMENGRWWRIVAEKRKKKEKEGGGKKYDDAIYSPGKSFVLEEWLSLCKPPNTSTFSIVPPSSVTRGFLFRGQAFSREIAPL